MSDYKTSSFKKNIKVSIEDNSVLDLVVDQIRRNIGNYSFETGGILGGKGQKVSRFAFDKGKKQKDEDSFCPDIDKMNNVISNWRREEIQFLGLVHSHKVNPYLSAADIEYGFKIVLLNRMKWIYMPIYVLREDELIVYKLKM